MTEIIIRTILCMIVIAIMIIGVLMIVWTPERKQQAKRTLIKHKYRTIGIPTTSFIAVIVAILIYKGR